METKKSVILRTDREKLSNLKTKEKNGGGGRMSSTSAIV